MQQHLVTSNSSVKPMHLRMHPITIGFGMFLVSAFVLISLLPCVSWWQLKWYEPWDTYEHGWPVTYMVREKEIDADMSGFHHDPWPFWGDPPLLEFFPAWLAFDIVVALCLIVLTSLSIESWLRVRQVRLRFSLRSLLAIMGLACVLCALSRLMIRDSADCVKAALYALILFPGIVVFLAICLSGVFLTKSILTFLRRPKNGTRKGDILLF